MLAVTCIVGISYCCAALTLLGLYKNGPNKLAHFECSEKPERALLALGNSNSTTFPPLLFSLILEIDEMCNNPQELVLFITIDM